MKEEKLLKLLEKEFGENFIIFTGSEEIHLVNLMSDYVGIRFKIDQKYLLSAIITEFPFLETRARIRKLPSIKLETEEQVIQSIKIGYDYFQCKYKMFNIMADCMTKGMLPETEFIFDVVL